MIERYPRSVCFDTTPHASPKSIWTRTDACSLSLWCIFLCRGSQCSPHIRILSPQTHFFLPISRRIFSIRMCIYWRRLLISSRQERRFLWKVHLPVPDGVPSDKRGPHISPPENWNGTGQWCCDPALFVRLTTTSRLQAVSIFLDE